MTDKKRRVAEAMGWDYFEPFGWMDSDGAVGGRQVDYNTPALFCDAIEQWLPYEIAYRRSKRGHSFTIYPTDNSEDAYHSSLCSTKQDAYIEAVCQMLDMEGE